MLITRHLPDIIITIISKSLGIEQGVTVKWERF